VGTRVLDPARPPDLIAGDLLLHRTQGLLVVRFMDDEETRWACADGTSPVSMGTDRKPDVWLYPDHPTREWSGEGSPQWPPPDGVLLGDVLLIWRPTWRRMDPHLRR
jgi:hypothetical protein